MFVGVAGRVSIFKIIYFVCVGVSKEIWVGIVIVNGLVVIVFCKVCVGVIVDVFFKFVQVD